jgi:hypothetical protein
MPVAAALAITHSPSRKWIALAIVIADVAILALPVVWVAVAIVVAAAGLAARSNATTEPQAA